VTKIENLSTTIIIEPNLTTLRIQNIQKSTRLVSILHNYVYFDVIQMFV